MYGRYIGHQLIHSDRFTPRTRKHPTTKTQIILHHSPGSRHSPLSRRPRSNRRRRRVVHGPLIHQQTLHRLPVQLPVVIRIDRLLRVLQILVNHLGYAGPDQPRHQKLPDVLEQLFYVVLRYGSL